MNAALFNAIAVKTPGTRARILALLDGPSGGNLGASVTGSASNSSGPVGMSDHSGSSSGSGL